MNPFLRRLLRGFGWIVLVALVCALVSAVVLAAFGGHLRVSLGDDAQRVVSELGTADWLLAIGAMALAWSIALVAVPLSLAFFAAMIALGLAWAFAPLIVLLALVWWLVRRARRGAATDAMAS
jgi:hypothetical protein